MAGFPRVALRAPVMVHQIGAPSIHTPRIGAETRGLAAMEAFRIDEIARRLLERVPPALRSMQQDLESNFRAVLRERLSKLDLVSRDEFDAQTRVLERTRAQLEALEARLAALEGGAPGTVVPKGPGSGAALG
jgi:ubiquinone biosynthesis accessory factor UbiK